MSFNNVLYLKGQRTHKFKLYHYFPIHVVHPILTQKMIGTIAFHPLYKREQCQHFLKHFSSVPQAKENKTT